MKKSIYKIILIFFIFLMFPFNTLAFSFNVNSKEVLLINLNDKSIIYEDNIDEKTYIASLTKIMTAVIVLENVDDLNKSVMILPSDISSLPFDTALSNLYVNKNYTYLDLLYGLMLPSGADCANALARSVFNDYNLFIEKMNEKKDMLGMTNTHFSNPHGLDDANNYSTARDISKLFLYAIDNPYFYKIISTMNYMGLEHTFSYYLNKYHLVMNYLIGGKTGNEVKAGFCLASLATYNNIDYMLITLNAPYSYYSPNHFIDAKNIYEYYFNNYNYQTIYQMGDVLKSYPTKYLKDDFIEIKADKDYKYYLENNYKDNISFKYVGKTYVDKYLKKGDKLGTIYILYNDKELDKIDIILDRDVKFSFLKYFKANIDMFILLILSLVLFVISIVCLIKKLRKSN